MYNTPKKVIGIRETLISRIKDSLKNKTYRKLKSFSSNEPNTLSILKCWYFEFDEFNLLLGKIKNTTTGGSFIYSEEKPIIWMNTWNWDTSLPLIFSFQIPSFIRKRQFVLDHELTHFVDNGYKSFASRFKDKKSKIDYYNSGVEINAYFSHILLGSKNFWDFVEKLDKSYFSTKITRKNRNLILKRAYLYYNT